MRTSTSLLAIITFGTGVVAGGALFAPAIAQNAQPTADSAPQKLLTIGEVHDKLVAQGYRDIDDIEREGKQFEAKAANAQGERVNIAVDATTGEVLGARSKSGKRDRGTKDREAARDQRGD